MALTELFSINAGFRATVAVLVLRLLPFAAWAVLTPSLNKSVRLTLPIVYLVVLAVALRLGMARLVLWSCLGTTYYLVLCSSIGVLTGRIADGRISRTGLFFLLCTLLLLAPGFALPGVAISTFLIVGWELLFRAFSFCVETSRPGAPSPSMRDTLFVLLLNPTLLYAARGTAATPAPGPGALRALLGVGLLTLNAGTLGAIVPALRLVAVASTQREWWEFGIARVCLELVSHSALASVQIGLLRIVGWIAPERYDYPLLAISPAEFWKRWNTYMRVWLEAYVFFPLIRSLSRVRRHPGIPIGAVAITLLASGLLHDVFTLAGRGVLILDYTMFFGASAVFLTLWETATFARAPKRARSSGTSTLAAFSSSLVQRGVLLAALTAGAAAWG